MMYNEEKKAVEMTTQFAHVYIERNASYRGRCSKKAKAMEAAGKMQVNKRLFDPKYSATIEKYAHETADEVADIVDKKYIEFFRKHPTKEDFDAKTIVEELINDTDLHRHFK